MKKKLLIACCTLLAACALGIGGFYGVGGYLRSLPPKGEPEIHESGGICEDFISIVSGKTNYFIATSELIVRGTFTGETDGPKFLDACIPFSCEGFHVTEVYKGDCKPGDDIAFARIGGEVSLYQMLKDAEKLGIEDAAYARNAGFSKGLKSYDLKKDSIYRLDPEAKKKYELPKSEEYVLFLYRDTMWDCYSVGITQAYHIRKVNEQGEVWNPFDEEYETIDWDVATKLTKEDVLSKRKKVANYK